MDGVKESLGRGAPGTVPHGELHWAKGGPLWPIDVDQTRVAKFGGGFEEGCPQLGDVSREIDIQRAALSMESVVGNARILGVFRFQEVWEHILPLPAGGPVLVIDRIAAHV